MDTTVYVVLGIFGFLFLSIFFWYWFRRRALIYVIAQPPIPNTRRVTFSPTQDTRFISASSVSSKAEEMV